MRVKHVYLQNYCNHRHRDIEIGPGLTAILGANGAGKSNFVDGIFFGFTGESRNDGVKLDNICQLAGPKDKSLVRIDFEHGGVNAQITRSLRPNGSCLQVGGHIYRKANEIERELESILGISKRLLSDFIFIPQKGLDGLLGLSSSERATSFQRLFGTWRAERCYKVVTDHLSQLSSHVVDVQFEKLEAAYEDTEAHIRLLRDRLAQYDDIPDNWDPGNDEDHLMVVRCKQRPALEERVVELEGLIQANQQARNQVKEDLERAEENYNEIKKVCDEGTGEYQQALDAAEYWRKAESRRRSKETTFQLLEWERNALKDLASNPPLKPPTFIDPNDKTISDQMSERVDEWTRAKRYIKNFDPATGKAVCSECMTPVSSLMGTYEHFKFILPALEEKVLSDQKAMNDSREYLAACQLREDKVAGIKSRIALFEDTLLKMVDEMGEPPALSEEQAKTVLTDYHHMNKGLAELEHEVSSLTAKLQYYDAIDERDHKALDRVFEDLSAISISNEQLAALELRYKTKSRRYREKLELKADLRAQMQKLLIDKKHLEEASLVHNRSQHTLKWAKKLDTVRSILHRDSLPKTLSERYLEVLESDINNVLEELSGPFRVKRGDDLNFRAIFDDGRDVPAQRLSGAEKAIFSLAMRVVVNSTFAGDIGLLCLDEPTDGLDHDNLRCLEIALDRLRGLSQSLGLQVLLITHERRLAPLFDAVVEL